MCKSLYRLMMPVLLAGAVLFVSAAPGANLDTFRVRDEAGLFSKEALRKADARIEEIKKHYNKDVLIETFAQVPDNMKAQMSKQDEKAFFRTWARQRYETQLVRGIYVLVCKSPRWLQVQTGKATNDRAFTETHERELRDKMAAHLAGEPDRALLDGVGFIASTLDRTIGKQAARGDASSPAVPAAPTPAHGRTSSGPWGWLCLGAVVLLGVWVVFGLLRYLGGAGSPPPAQYPGPGYPGGYAAPAGGGGFFSGLLGGMLGGAAGSWMYDSFFRGSSGTSGAGMSPSTYEGTPAPSATDDLAEGGGSEGGAWGDDGGWSDAGADGGGDWGGDDSAGGSW